MATSTENEKQIGILRIMIKSLGKRVKSLEDALNAEPESTEPIDAPDPAKETTTEPKPEAPDISKMNRDELVKHATEKGVECEGKTMAVIREEIATL